MLRRCGCNSLDSGDNRGSCRFGGSQSVPSQPQKRREERGPPKNRGEELPRHQLVLIINEMRQIEWEGIVHRVADGSQCNQGNTCFGAHLRYCRGFHLEDGVL